MGKLSCVSLCYGDHLVYDKITSLYHCVCGRRFLLGVLGIKETILRTY